MQIQWRKLEKEVSENRKKAQKEAIEKQKREEERREAERQQRKLEFLLTQTELYSHFIGSKMGLIDGEKSTSASDAAGSASLAEEGAAATLVPGTAEEKVSDGDDTSIKSADDASLLTTEMIRRIKEDEEAVAFKHEAAEAAKERVLMNMQKKNAFDLEIRRAKGESASEADTKMLEEKAQKSEELDLLNPSTMPTEDYLVKEPSIFRGKLKTYQLKGLNWLINLYEQGINGILADEMGLGKTIQSISFLTYLASKNIWGPFLVVCPSSTLHQWQQEIAKFCPELTVLPYWGNQKERQIIRKYWNSKQLYVRDAAFHVLITSYHVVVADEKYFHRLNWQFLLLDEAQAIKNASSQRWKSLLGLRCRSRLLLTGTPIQNSMAELWALLHFIMPEFFDSHEEFNEWFSKDIQANAAGGDNSLTSAQLQRLHVILKPFMLRRVKKDVEHEMPPKIEVEVACHLSARQRLLYRSLQNKVMQCDEFSKEESLMNLVMQFRKVCNHPQMLKHHEASSPYNFVNDISDCRQSTLHSNTTARAWCRSSSPFSNPISLAFPRLIHRSRRVCVGRNPAHLHPSWDTNSASRYSF